MRSMVVLRKAIFSLFGMILLPLCAVVLPAQEHEKAYPQPEILIRGEDASDYIKAAAQFLKSHPQSPLAPRVALDLLMVATARNNSRLIQDTKTLLILDYPSSLQGLYLFTTFDNGEDYREFLSKVLDRNLGRLTGEFAKKFCGALQRGLKRFGKAMLGDAGFVLKCGLLAQEAGEKGFREMLFSRLEQLGKLDDKSREIVRIAFDEEKSLSEKVVELHGSCEGETARFFERFLLSRMSEADRNSPRIMRTAVESCLLESKLAEALPLLEKLSGDDAADQLLFWRAWCRASTGEGKRALVLLNELEERYPDSQWRGTGEELARSVKNLDRNLDVYADAILAMITEMKKGIGAFEATALYADETKKFNIYLSLVPDENSIEFHVLEGKTHLFAYKSGGDGSLLFAKGEPVIHRFRERGPIPAPSFNLERLEDGTYRLLGNMGVHSSLDGLAAASESLVNSPVLSTRAGLMELLKRQVNRGSFPIDVVTADDKRTFAWVKPEVDRPEVSRLEYSVSAGNKLTSFEFARLSCDNIRYGPKGSFEFVSPPLPEVKVEVHEKFDPVLFFRFFANVIEIFAPKG